MKRTKSDKESIFLLGLIVFGLLLTLVVEFFQIKVRPVILLIFIGISTTALIYKQLGGLKESVFGTQIFKISGSGAFLFAFIYFINPILERQTFPTDKDIFDPPISTWMAVDNENLQPISFKTKYLGFKFDTGDYGIYNANELLFFTEDKNDLIVYKDDSRKVKLGTISKDALDKKFHFKNQVEIKNDEVFLTNIEINGLTPSRSWIPFRIKPVQFDNNTTSYELIGNEGEVLVRSEIKLRGSKIHKVKNRVFVVTIHRVNHESEPYWVRFAIAELKLTSNAGSE